MSIGRVFQLGELVDIYDGPHATPTRRDSGPYFLNISSLNSGRLDLEESDHVSEEDFEKWTRRITPQANDLLFSYETRLGEAALMPQGVQACLGRRMAILRPKPNSIDPHFLLYLYLSPQFKRVIEKNTIHGATVNRIPLKEMGTWNIQIPSPGEQKSIAEVLVALDEKIAVNSKIIRLSEEIGTANFIRVGFTDTQNYSAIQVAELIEFNPKHRILDGQYTSVDMQALPTSGPVVASWTRKEKSGGSRFQNNDTLLGRITPCLQNRKTGFVDFLNDEEIGIGSTEFIVMRSRSGIPQSVAYFLAINEDFRKFAISQMTGTSGRQRVAASDLERYEIADLPIGAINEFGAKANAGLKQSGALRNENRTLTEIRDALLPQLMSGKLSVRDAEHIAQQAGV